MKKILWNRKLSCGHERETGVAFAVGVYKKPKVKSKAFCRQCNSEVEIIKVEEVK